MNSSVPPAPIRKRLTIIIGAGVLFAAVAIWVGQNDPSGYFSLKPKYDGCPLSYWMHHWYLNSWGPVNARAVDAVRSMGPKALPLLIDWIDRPYTSAPGFSYPEQALRGFEVLGPAAKSAVPKLMAMIGKRSGYPRRALECIGSEAVPALADKLVETIPHTNQLVTNWRQRGFENGAFNVQECILRTLSQMGTNAEAAIPALIQAVNIQHGWRYGSNPYTALVSVGGNHPDVVFTALVAALTNSTTLPSNRGAIAGALASLNSNQTEVSLPVLVRVLKDKATDDLNRRQIAGAVAAVGHARADFAVPALISAFTNTATEYRDGIAQALATFGSEARPALPVLLSGSKSPYFWLQLQAAVAVKTIAPERTNALDPLIRAMKVGEPAFRQQSIYALERLGTNAAEAIPALIKCLSHPDPQTRIDAERCLNKTGVLSDEMIANLFTNAFHPNTFVADEAVSTLAAHAGQSRQAFTTLLKVMAPSGSNARQKAKYRLLELVRSDPKYLLLCLEDTEALVRNKALSIFYNLERSVPDSVPILVRLLDDTDPTVRSSAAKVLILQDPDAAKAHGLESR
jgi:HEAT repeat protein